MANLSKILEVDLLQEGMASALSVLFAIEAGEMLHALPPGEADAVKHNHALRMLNMLNDSLLLIQAEIDSRGVAA